jgi:hypothetical protein
LIHVIDGKSYVKAEYRKIVGIVVLGPLRNKRAKIVFSIPHAEAVLFVNQLAIIYHADNG